MVPAWISTPSNPASRAFLAAAAQSPMVLLMSTMVMARGVTVPFKSLFREGAKAGVHCRRREQQLAPNPDARPRGMGELKKYRTTLCMHGVGDCAPALHLVGGEDAGDVDESDGRSADPSGLRQDQTRRRAGDSILHGGPSGPDQRFGPDLGSSAPSQSGSWLLLAEGERREQCLVFALGHRNS